MNGLIYSPDGKLLGASSLLAGQEVMTAVWDVETGEELFTLPTSIANFGEDGERLIAWHTTSSSVIWDVWDVATVEIVETINLRINDLAWSAGGALTIDWKYFAVRYWDNRIGCVGYGDAKEGVAIGRT